MKGGLKGWLTHTCNKNKSFLRIGWSKKGIHGFICWFPTWYMSKRHFKKEKKSNACTKTFLIIFRRKNKNQIGASRTLNKDLKNQNEMMSGFSFYINWLTHWKQRRYQKVLLTAFKFILSGNKKENVRRIQLKRTPGLLRKLTVNTPVWCTGLNGNVPQSLGR